MPRSPSSAPWAVQARANVRSAVDCPTCPAKRGEYCVNDEGRTREANHAARHQLATGEDPIKYAWGNAAARAKAKRGRRRRLQQRATPGGWG